MRLITSSIAIAACIALAGCKSEDDEAREMLAAALQDYATVQDEAQPIDARLAAAQTVKGTLDRIVQDYGTTDLGLQLAAGGTVGEISTAELQQRIAALEDARAFAQCDQTPTPACVVDHLVADLNYPDRGAMYDRLDGTDAMLMALALGDPEAATGPLLRSSDDGIRAYAVASAPTEGLDDRIIADALADFDGRTTDMAAALAAYRVLQGDDDAVRRRVAEAAPTGRGLLEIFAADVPVAERMTLIDTRADDGSLDWDAMRNAQSLLSSFEQMQVDDLLFALLIQAHGAAEVLATLPEGAGGDFDRIRAGFGRDLMVDRVSATLADPAADPRSLSLALMAAAVDLPADDLRGAVAGLAGREVMQWDNVRIYPTFVSLGYLGDRALFDTVLTTLTPDTVHAAMEGAWDTGRGLAEGQVAEAALGDSSLFNAAIDVASARGTAADLAAFLRDAIAKAGDTPDDFSRTTSRTDIVSAARRCGLPEIVTAIDATQQDVDRVFGTCDRDRLGTRFDTMPQEAFDIYVDNADLFVADALDILAATRSSAPDRAYAFVQAVPDMESRVPLTAFLAFMLAQS